VKIMKAWDPTGKEGPKIPLPDVVVVHNPKEEEVYADKPVIGKEGMEAGAPLPPPVQQFDAPPPAAEQPAY